MHDGGGVRCPGVASRGPKRPQRASTASLKMALFSVHRHPPVDISKLRNILGISPGDTTVPHTVQSFFINCIQLRPDPGFIGHDRPTVQWLSPKMKQGCELGRIVTQCNVLNQDNHPIWFGIIDEPKCFCPSQPWTTSVAFH